MVLRILGSDASHLELEQLGLTELDLYRYRECIKRTNGIILISGPTGSGKTTTLYATLKELNKEAKNILTIEDPIEYTLRGINQVQLKESIGLDFARSLRTFLRQDPDIIMVGEIRDPETANMAIRASLTGHLVLSTIHTNSAWGTISRLVDMNIAPYLISGTLVMSMAQRLVRKLCEHCKKECIVSKEDVPVPYQPRLNDKKIYRPAGCDNCFYTGYRGRTAIYEVVQIDTELVEQIKLKRQEIRELYTKKNISTLSDQAIYLLERGVTSLEEVYPLLLSNM